MQGEYRAYTIRDLVDAAELAYLCDSSKRDSPEARFLDIRTLIGAAMNHPPVPQADARITFDNHIEQASEYTFKIDSIAGESRDSLSREILKLALTNEKAWFALRRVFLEHTCPQNLDPMGREIRSILLSLDKDYHGKGKTEGEEAAADDNDRA